MDSSSSSLAGTYSNPYSSLAQSDHDHHAATAAAALSQEHTPSQNGSSRKRKATTTVPGSRGVANLTPEQLSKKRANDREAQRAIRQRTKDTIETLATRIKELESQQPFQEIQRITQERDRALQECEDLKKKLATVASVIGNGQQQAQSGQSQPNLHGTFDAFEQFIDYNLLTQSDIELAAVTAQQSPLPPLNTANAPHTYPQPPASAGAPYEQQHIHPDLRSPRSATNSSPGTQIASASSAYHSDGPGMRRWSPGIEHTSHPHYSPMNGSPYEQRLPQMQPQSNGERLGLNFLLEPKQHASKPSPPISQPRYIPPAPRTQPLYLQLPLNSPASCPLDSLLLDFLTGRRQKAAAGLPISEVAGPPTPYLYALVEPNAVYSKHCHPVSALLIDILSKFQYNRVPEKVAVLYIMFLILHWQICPCAPCYEMIPTWARPTREQLETPHPAWHDHVPWPAIRRNLVRNNNIKFEDFFIPFTTRQCLNWPYPSEQVLIPAPDRSDDDPNALAVNPVFESHLRDLKNWSLGTQFAADLPGLVDESVRITDEGVGMPH